MDTTIKKVLLLMIVPVVVAIGMFQPTKLDEDVIPLKTIQSPPTIPVILKKISWCESQNRQFNADGSLYIGEINPQDIGKYQVNEYYHLEASRGLKMDIYTLKGNTDYALYLYKNEGTTPWNWSKHCWNNPNRIWFEKDGNYWSK